MDSKLLRTAVLSSLVVILLVVLSAVKQPRGKRTDRK